MDRLTTLYNEHKDWFLFGLAWLLGIPGSIIANRLDTYLRKRSKEQQIKILVAHYTRVAIQRREINFSNFFTVYFHKAFEFLKVVWLTMAISAVHTFFNPLFVKEFGEHASDLYFYSIFIFLCILDSIVIGIAATEDNILRDAMHFSEYRKKTIANLTKLDYDDLGILDRIDRLIFQQQ